MWPPLSHSQCTGHLWKYLPYIRVPDTCSFFLLGLSLSCSSMSWVCLYKIYVFIYMCVYMHICIYWLHYLANAAWSFQTLLWHLVEYNKSFACSFLLFNFLIQFLCWWSEWANTVGEDRSGHPFLPCFSCGTSNVSAYKHDIKSLCFVSVRWYTVDCICLLSLDMRSGEGKVPFVSSFLLKCKLQEGQDFSAYSSSSASCSVQLRADPQGVFLKTDNWGHSTLSHGLRHKKEKHFYCIRRF